MRKILAALCLVACVAGCAAIQHTATITLEQAQAGLQYLQATYTRLIAAGAIPSLANLEADISELDAVITKGDLSAAVTLYDTARARVTAIAASLGTK